ncbi:MAG: ATP-dependent DNA helicase UvrD2 [Nocardia sp.]|nr:ATP-dependent DNA helicase UvrD2 [Nocardia sp.]
MMVRVPALDLTALDPEQAAAVRAPRGPVCVLAGAGTGKTRTITHRIAHLIADGHVKADQVLAVTFTARAAGEMRNRLRTMGLGGDAGQVQARTFHAAALRQLRYFWPQVVGDVPWRLIDSKFPVVSQAAQRAGLRASTEMVRDLLSEIEWAKASLIAPEDYPAAAARHHRDAPVDVAKVAEVYQGYESAKASADGLLLDFDDLLLHTAAALEDYPAVADEFRGRYRSFVVDEYQDVTPLQQRVLDAWLGERDDLTVVGDANQTIYSFTGATPSYLLDFSRRFPDATVVRLERDYRSTPQVVSLANQVIGAARGRIAGTRLALIGQRPDGPEPEFAEYADAQAEAVAVVGQIQKLIAAGTPASEIAILYRTNALSEPFEQVLGAQAIPFQVRGGEGFFHRQEVRQAVSALRQVDARDDLPDEARSGSSLITLVRAALAPVGLTAEEPAGAQAKERWSSLLALVQLTEELVSHNDQMDLTALLRELATRAEAKHPPTVDGVTLASLHAAKGLEWDAVFLAGLTDGTLPIFHVLGKKNGPVDEAGLEEERRLLYVGVTRAREHLSLSWTQRRLQASGDSRPVTRSRFLTGLIPDSSPATRIAVESTAESTRPLCRVCDKPLLGTYATMLGRCKRCPGEVDPQLLEALEEWRAEKAEVLRRRDFVVFTDTTLTAIAEQLPTDDAALASIAGIGPQKIKDYGADVLAIVASRLRAKAQNPR